VSATDNNNSNADSITLTLPPKSWHWIPHAFLSVCISYPTELTFSLHDDGKRMWILCI